MYNFWIIGFLYVILVYVLEKLKLYKKKNFDGNVVVEFRLVYVKINVFL